MTYEEAKKIAGDYIEDCIIYGERQPTGLEKQAGAVIYKELQEAANGNTEKLTR